MRTFIAIDLPDEIKNRITVLLEDLASRSKGVKWIKRQGMHITLKFLGEISFRQSEEVILSLQRIAEKKSRFFIKIKGTGAFPEDRRLPRILWTGIEENKDLDLLQKDVEKELDLIGFPKEKRQFHPHLTLGRVKSAEEIDKALSFLKREEKTVFGEWETDRITFYRSLLKPNGAEYQIIKEVRLK